MFAHTVLITLDDTQVFCEVKEPVDAATLMALEAISTDEAIRHLLTLAQALDALD